MEFTTLDHFTLSELVECHNQAFSDYAQPMQLSEEKLKFINHIRGVRYDLSIGAVDGGQLIGFISNAVRNWRGKLTAYDCGTGIIPSYQGKSISKKMFQKCIDLVKTEGVTQYLLEVIQSNTKAFNLYQKQGFHITRAFDLVACENPFHQKTEHSEAINTPNTKSEEEVKVEEIPILKIVSKKQTFMNFWDYPPSWQCSFDTITTMPQNCRALIAYSEQDNPIGYIICNTNSGELYHLAVVSEFRRKHVGQVLLESAQISTQNHPGSFMMNIDTRNQALLNFLSKNRFNSFEKQYEMQLDLV